jgi:hypothetical protein
VRTSATAWLQLGLLVLVGGIWIVAGLSSSLALPGASYRSPATTLEEHGAGGGAALVGRLDHAYGLAYISNGDVWLKTKGQSAVVLVDSGDAVEVRISRDGAAVGFVREETGQRRSLWAVNANGANERQLVSAEELATMASGSRAVNVWPVSFDWILGSQAVVYSTIEAPLVEGYAQHNDLRLVNADTLEKATLLQPGQGGVYLISPDGNHIAVNRTSGLMVRDLLSMFSARTSMVQLRSSPVAPLLRVSASRRVQ